MREMLPAAGVKREHADSATHGRLDGREGVEVPSRWSGCHGRDARPGSACACERGADAHQHVASGPFALHRMPSVRASRRFLEQSLEDGQILLDPRRIVDELLGGHTRQPQEREDPSAIEGCRR